MACTSFWLLKKNIVDVSYLPNLSLLITPHSGGIRWFLLFLIFCTWSFFFLLYDGSISLLVCLPSPYFTQPLSFDLTKLSVIYSFAHLAHRIHEAHSWAVIHNIHASVVVIYLSEVIVATYLTSNVAATVEYIIPLFRVPSSIKVPWPTLPHWGHTLIIKLTIENLSFFIFSLLYLWWFLKHFHYISPECCLLSLTKFLLYLCNIILFLK